MRALTWTAWLLAWLLLGFLSSMMLYGTWSATYGQVLTDTDAMYFDLCPAVVTFSDHALYGTIALCYEI